MPPQRRSVGPCRGEEVVSSLGLPCTTLMATTIVVKDGTACEFSISSYLGIPICYIEM